MIASVYKDLVPAEWYSEYKKTNDEKRKEELIQSVFKIVRSVNVFPDKHLDFNDEITQLRALATMDMSKMYKEDKKIHEGVIGISAIGQSLCYKFYPNIWDVRKDGSAKVSMRQAFFDDKFLLRSIRCNLQFDSDVEGLRSWIRQSGCGYCVNFKPAVARAVYDLNLSRGSRVLDYSAGYGGRLLGAHCAEMVNEYVGIEPNTETFNNALKFVGYLNTYSQPKTCKMLQIGSEDFTKDKYPEYVGYFDMAFSSPPYFDVEVYSDEPTQSYNRYPDYKDWVKFYLQGTINNCIDMLKPDGIFAVNIYDLGDKDSNKTYNIKDIIKAICGSRGFLIYKKDTMKITVRRGGGDRDDEKSEPIWYFRSRDYLKSIGAM